MREKSQYAKAVERLKKVAKKHLVKEEALPLQKSDDLRRFRAKKLIGMLSGKIGDIDAKEAMREWLEIQAKKAEMGE